MAQQRFLESVETDHFLDPLLKSLLRHHRMEELTLMAYAIAETMSADDISDAIDGYFSRRIRTAHRAVELQMRFAHGALAKPGSMKCLIAGLSD